MLETKAMAPFIYDEIGPESKPEEGTIWFMEPGELGWLDERELRNSSRELISSFDDPIYVSPQALYLTEQMAQLFLDQGLNYSLSKFARTDDGIKLVG
jgi:hypothetical protein